MSVRTVLLFALGVLCAVVIYRERNEREPSLVLLALLALTLLLLVMDTP